jgi:prepilin-type N-terminal cleavage/methylation domain-containing protein
MESKKDLLIIAKLFKSKRCVSQNAGFTLIELLVSIGILGILAAIAIPSYTNQARKARQTEAILSINACQKKQTAYYIEKLQFTDSLDILGIKQETENFQYRVEIFPPSDPNDKDTLACCLANEKGSFGQLFSGCVSNTSI